jgi:hypothetical protein
MQTQVKRTATLTIGQVMVRTRLDKSITFRFGQHQLEIFKHNSFVFR